MLIVFHFIAGYRSGILRGRAVVARRDHSPEVVGSIPTPATLNSCFMNKYNKIAEGNSFTICIPQAVIDFVSGDITSISASALIDVKIEIGGAYKRT